MKQRKGIALRGTESALEHDVVALKGRRPQKNLRRRLACWVGAVALSSSAYFFATAANNTTRQHNINSTPEQASGRVSAAFRNKTLSSWRHDEASQNSHEQQAPAEVVVFYNLYATSYDESTEAGARTWSILREQFAQIRDSPMAVLLTRQNRRLPVYYNTIGAAPPPTTAFQSEFCRGSRLDCQHLQHVTSGFEDVTLSQLHSHCVQHPDTVVIYLHNKGSLTTKPYNDAFRRALTAAATSQQCHAAIRSDDASSSSSCQACGLFLETYPFVYLNGNMWQARCDYVRHLLPTSEFASRLQRVHAEFKALLQQRVLTKGLSGKVLSNWLIGSGRFGWEHYLGHVPSFAPCDLSARVSSDWDWKNQSFAAAPEALFALRRHPAARPFLEQPWDRRLPQPNAKALQNPQRRKRDFLLLPGLLVKYAILNEGLNESVLPSMDSWIWDHYPDGAYWKEQFAPLLISPNATKGISDLYLSVRTILERSQAVREALAPDRRPSNNARRQEARVSRGKDLAKPVQHGEQTSGHAKHSSGAGDPPPRQRSAREDPLVGEGLSSTDDVVIYYDLFVPPTEGAERSRELHHIQRTLEKLHSKKPAAAGRPAVSHFFLFVQASTRGDSIHAALQQWCRSPLCRLLGYKDVEQQDQRKDVTVESAVRDFCGLRHRKHLYLSNDQRHRAANNALPSADRMAPIWERFCQHHDANSVVGV